MDQLDFFLKPTVNVKIFFFRASEFWLLFDSSMHIPFASTAMVSITAHLV